MVRVSWIRSVVFLLAAMLIFMSCQQVWQAIQQQIQMSGEPDRSASQSIVLSNSSQFQHPGVLNHALQLDQARQDSSSQRVQAHNQIAHAIDNLLPFPSSFPSTVLVRTPPHSPTPSESQMWNDSILVYAYALKWTRSGKSADADRAKQILNGWAANFERIRGCGVQDTPQLSGCPGVQTDGLQRRLQAAWVAPNFAAAAEIIRHYEIDGRGAGWSSADIRNFERFLETLQVDYIETLVQGIQRGGTGWAANNWGASGIWAKMSVAVFLSNAAWYNDAVNRSKHLIHNTIQPSGEVNECERSNYSDCLHPQMSLTALTYAAETAVIQGDASIYHAHSERLREGWNWMDRAFRRTVSCKNVDFSCGNSEQIMPGIEVAQNHYDAVGTVSATTGVRTLKERQAPYGVVTRQFMGFTSYTHLSN